MITLTTLFVLLYSYSVYRIRTDSGSWKRFDPCNSNAVATLLFLFGTVILVVALAAALGYSIEQDLIP